MCQVMDELIAEDRRATIVTLKRETGLSNGAIAKAVRYSVEEVEAILREEGLLEENNSGDNATDAVRGIIKNL